MTCFSDIVSSVSSASPPAEPGRGALSRLLERIRRQRARRTGQQTAGTSHDAQEEPFSVETGSLSSLEKASGGSLDEQTPSTTHTEDGKHSAFTSRL